MYTEYIAQAETSLHCVLAWMPHIYRAAYSIPLNTYRASRSISVFVRVVNWNMSAPNTSQQQHCIRSAAYHAARPTVRPFKVRTCLVFTASCLRSKIRIKCWFSSQWWPLTTKDPTVVLHMDGTHLLAKFRRCTSRHFRGDIMQRLRQLSIIVYTVGQKKTFHFILDHNSHISWWISTLCALIKTGRNTLSGNYKICNIITAVSVHYLRKFKNTQSSMTVSNHFLPYVRSNQSCATFAESRLAFIVSSSC